MDYEFLKTYASHDIFKHWIRRTKLHEKHNEDSMIAQLLEVQLVNFLILQQNSNHYAENLEENF